MNFLFIFLSLCPQGINDTIKLEPVSITANIVSQSIRNTARNVSIIDQKMIEAAPVKTIDGVLQYALNVDVRSRSATGVQADISIRGGHYDQTLIMVDGIKVNDPQTGHHSLNFPISLQNIERIEVLQGGASRVFGPAAFSGVVNIITKKVKKSTFNGLASTGQYGLRMYAAGANYVKKGLSLKGSVETSKSEGFALNTAFDKKIWQISSSKSYDKGILTISTGLIKNDFGAANFYSPKFYKQYEEVSSQLSSMQWNHNYSNTLNGTLNASVKTHQDFYDFDEYRLNNKIKSVNFHKTTVVDIEYKMRQILKHGSIAYGLEYRSENVLSNRLGETIAIPKPIKDYPEVFYTKQKNRENISAFFEANNKRRKVKLSEGLLINYNDQYGLAVYPGIDLNYKASENNDAYVSVNSSLRYPTFTELYLNTSTLKADPNLKPEKAISYELGLKTTHKAIFSTISVFYKQTKDAIDKIKRPNVQVPTMENIDNINMAGLEVNEILNVRSSSFINQINFNYAYLLADRKEDGFQSFYTLNYLRHKLSTGLSTKSLRGFSAGMWYTYKWREGTYQWENSTPAVKYAPIHIVDTRINYTKEKFRLFLDVNNLFDADYFEFGFVKQPGRWISTGVNIKM